jgi:hypothetical protein
MEIFDINILILPADESAEFLATPDISDVDTNGLYPRPVLLMFIYI